MTETSLLYSLREDTLVCVGLWHIVAGAFFAPCKIFLLTYGTDDNVVDVQLQRAATCASCNNIHEIQYYMLCQ